MLDTGNFVLASQESSNLWESFSHPTDTILPTQILNLGSQLVARFLETNYSNGRFMFALQSDGNLVLYTTDFPMDSNNFAYWSTQTMDSGFQVNMREDFYQRAILEYDGVFRQYVYPKSAASGTMAWSSLSKFIPENICTRIGASTGGGACGFNSYCRLGDNQRPSCHCPPGYTWLDPLDSLGGCRQNFVQQRCDAGTQEAGLFYFSEMLGVDWPYADYQHFKGVTQDWCRQACLGDCFCAHRKTSVLQTSPAMEGTNLRSFTYEELEEATNGFRDELGSGAFATVYKGALPHDDGINLIAVKKLERMEKEGDKEFGAEVKAIGRTNHKNLVQLLGYCNEGQHRLLVYEFMSNGSLATFLFGNSRPDWWKLGHIARGLGHDVKYLKKNCWPTSLAIGFQPEMLLLRSKLLARLSETNYSSGRFMFTLESTGNLAMYTTNFPQDSENFAYWSSKTTGSGFQVIFNQKNFAPDVRDESQMILADWVQDCYKEKRLDLLVGNDEEAFGDMEKLEKFVMIAIWCTQEDPSRRPTMKKVVQMLEGAAEVSIPPDSSFSSASILKVKSGDFIISNLLRLEISSTAHGLIWPRGYDVEYLEKNCWPTSLAIGFQLERILLLKKGSKVQLTSDGNFVLNDQEGEKIWPVDSTITGVAYAAMLDSGNFVLVRQDSINLWESFDNPTDTILPTQALNQGSKLCWEAYGMVLFNLLIFCRKNFEPAVEDENQMVLADWAYDSYLERKLDLLVEKDQEALDNMEKLEKFVMIAIWCIQEDPSQRPTMKKVTQMLEGAIEVPLPPDPSPFSKSFPHQP
ncbi:unnamed protein product, partial [Vitis vinifera]